ncbi:lipoprotein [Streptomyces sp. NBC_00287]|uniref:lipoprotein n=1 Tax=Streptomyces sp. NBC_00287 TaxID=2975702 RepID=UPI002E2DA9F0|nr:lipoprotein [Streptomyces sp. NBC_00287]
MTGRRAACAAVLVVLLTGCGSGAQDNDDAKASATAEDSSVAHRGGSLGAEGSACELPVTFDIAKEWKAEAVDGSVDGEVSQDIADALLRQGPVALVCEVDAKPAGNIGFLRAWTGEPGGDDARTVLEAFVAAQDGVSKEQYDTFTAGDLTGAEVTYLYSDEFLDESKEESALAVSTAQGPVVLHLGGLDTEEHRAMLPAFELAKKTLRTGGNE